MLENIYIKYTLKGDEYPKLRTLYQKDQYELPKNKEGDIKEYQVSHSDFLVSFNVKEITDAQARFDKWKAENEKFATITEIDKQQFLLGIVGTNQYKNEIKLLDAQRGAKLSGMYSKIREIEFDSDEIALDRLDRVITIKTANMLKDMAGGKSAKEAYKDNFTDFVFGWNDRSANQQLINVEDAVSLQTQNLNNLIAVWVGVEPDQVPTILEKAKLLYQQQNAKK